MHSFKDVEGREWSIELDIPLLIQFEEITGRSLFAEMGEGNFGVKVACQLAYIACQEQANKAKLADLHAFTRAIGKGALSAVVAAVTDEVNEFFPGKQEPSPDPTATDISANSQR